MIQMFVKDYYIWVQGPRSPVVIALSELVRICCDKHMSQYYKQ